MTLFKICWRIGFGGLLAVFGLRLIWLAWEYYDKTERELVLMFWREYLVLAIAGIALYIGEEIFRERR